MTPFHMLAVLDDAIAAAPRGRRAIALELHTPGGRVTILDYTTTGRHLGVDDDGPVYGFTRRQCEEMRAVIMAAAAEDASTPGVEREGPDYTGDVAWA